MSIAEFSHDPDLIDLIRAELAAVHADAAGPIPDAGDVIDEVLAWTRRDLREEADALAACRKVDDCTAQAIVRRRLADYLEGQL